MIWIEWNEMKWKNETNWINEIIPNTKARKISAVFTNKKQWQQQRQQKQQPQQQPQQQQQQQ